MTADTLKQEKDRVEDPRRTRIIEGALEVFLAYGYSRTTMDDIARAVEMSRPSVYLHFRNKAEIYRAAAQAIFERSWSTAREALTEPRPFGERVGEALDRAMFKLFRIVAESPHGEELMDVNHNIASDLVAGWRSAMVCGFAKAIRNEAELRGVRLEERGLSAEALAEMLFDILEGLKARGVCSEKAEGFSRQFVTLVEIALEKR